MCSFLVSREICVFFNLQLGTGSPTWLAECVVKSCLNETKAIWGVDYPPPSEHKIVYYV